MRIPAGSTDQSVSVRAMATDGTILDSKVAADFTMWYRRGSSGTKQAISLSDLSAVDDAHVDGGLIHIDDGWYRVDVPDAAWATGVADVAIGGSVDGGVVLSGPVTLYAAELTINSTVISIED